MRSARPSAAAALLSDCKIVLEVTEGAREWLAERGYDPVYRARPLNRVIRMEVQVPPPSGEIADGDLLLVSPGVERLTFDRVGSAEVARAA